MVNKDYQKAGKAIRSKWVSDIVCDYKQWTKCGAVWFKLVLSSRTKRRRNILKHSLYTVERTFSSRTVC